MFQAVRSCDTAENGFQLHLIIPPTGGNQRDGPPRDEGSVAQKLKKKCCRKPANSPPPCYISILALTCCKMEKPIITSPSGTSQDTVTESALRCMTDTLTGAGGRSGQGT